MTKRNQEQLAREKSLYLYSSALAQGDFDTVSSILRLAEQDALLDQMIQELNQAYEDEREKPPIFEPEELRVQQLVHKHLSNRESEGGDEIPEVTVGEVVARLYAERAIPQADQAASQRLQGSRISVPRSPSRRSVKELEDRVGVSLSERFWQLFRETAIMLGLRASQQISYAAARNQRTKAGQRSQAGKSPKKDSGGADA